MTSIICESLREIGEVACVTFAWSSRGQTLKHTFFICIIDKWNNLPKDIAEAANLNTLRTD